MLRQANIKFLRETQLTKQEEPVVDTESLEHEYIKAYDELIKSLDKLLAQKVSVETTLSRDEVKHVLELRRQIAKISYMSVPYLGRIFNGELKEVDYNETEIARLMKEISDTQSKLAQLKKQNHSLLEQNKQLAEKIKAENEPAPPQDVGLQTQNTQLKELLTCMIIHSNMDWHKDEFLRTTMEI